MNKLIKSINELRQREAGDTIDAFNPVFCVVKAYNLLDEIKMR